MLRRLESIVITIFWGAIPLLVWPYANELFEFPKTLFLYFITGVLILILSWDSSFTITSWRKFREQPFSTFLLLILAANIISFLFSIDHYTSLFGYYTRFNGGLISILCVIFWTFYFIQKKLSANEIRSILLTILVSGFIVSIYAFFQKFGIHKDYWSEDSSKRVFSTLGQPNWLAAYLIPIFYIALYFGAKYQKNFFLKLLPATIVYAAAWFTYSISGIVAITISFIVFLYLNKAKTKIYLRQYWYVVPVILAVIFIASVPIRGRIEEQVENMTGIVTLLSTGKAGDFKPNYGDTGKIRLILWRGTFDLVISSPKQFLIGNGPETFVYAFPKFRPESINATSEANFIHNKPHNWYLEILSNLGILGLSAYLLFIYYNISLFIKNNKTFLTKTLFAGWISILITNFFGWPTVPLTILFFILPILFNDHLSKTKSKPEITFSYPKIIAFSLFSGFLILCSVIFGMADYNFKKSNYQKAMQLNPFEPRYELFTLIYEKEWSADYVLDFYERAKYNPYVVKTLVSYLDYYIAGENVAAKDFEIRDQIIKDAAFNSPADKQFSQ